MTKLSMKTAPISTLAFLTLSAVCSATPATAQKTTLPAMRITQPIDNTHHIAIEATSPSPLVMKNDLGAVDLSKQLHGITIDLSRTPAQQADLDALIVAQQDIHSPQYHQWLSPEQFGARFGANPADVAAISTWLQQQGFTIDRVARANNRIVFSGTAGQIEHAFGSSLHNIKLPDGSSHFAPSTNLSVPAAFAASVQRIRGLSDFRKRPRFRKAKQPQRTLHPHFTDDTNSYYELTPLDLATMYDVNAAYQAGYTGAGQSIAIVGQSYILPSDISTFQILAGVPTAKAPVYMLVPGSGYPARMAGDEGESDLDVEYSSTIGKGAQVYFVYTGNNENNGIDDSITYAIDEKIAPIVSSSYGNCELDEELFAGSSSVFTSSDLIYQQGAAQGQTLLVAAGDDGAVDCIEDTGDGYITTATGQSAAVDYPASSPYFTAMGGTSLTAAEYIYPNTTYWKNSTGGTALVSSVIKYIPETVWNDDDPFYGTSAGGGGTSLYEVQPTWQAAGTLIGGTGGVPIPTYPTITITSGRTKTTAFPRVVPDISLYASPNDPGMLVCSSDPESLFPGQVSSCTNGFYDAVSGDLTIFGGTSFDGPIFAGMLSVLSQALNANGLGNINSTLYGIAGTSAYATAFHDITTGGNQCYDINSPEPSVYTSATATGPMPTICGVTSSAITNFVASTGYDAASGLGSIDLNNLIAAWPKPASASLLNTTTTLTAAAGNPALSTSDLITITVASSGTTPAGSVTVSVDGAATTPTLSLTAGVAAYSFSSGFLGTHTITAVYSGDPTHAASSGALIVSTGTTIPSFTLAASNVTVTDGSTATSTVSITPLNGYKGLVNFSISSPSNLTNACASGSSLTVTGTTTQTAAITIYTNASNCPAGSVPLLRGATVNLSGAPHLIASAQPLTRPSHQPNLPVSALIAGLLFAFGLRGNARRLGTSYWPVLVVLLSLGVMGLTGCVPAATVSPSSAVTTPITGNIAPKGIYTLTLSAADSTNPTLILTTTLTLTVQ